MSLITPAEVIALTGSTLGTSVIQGVIDREEAGLAAPVESGGIGQLEGDRTETFILTSGTASGEVTLQRTTDAVEVVDNGDAVDAGDVRILADQRTLMLLVSDSDSWLRGAWLGPVEVTYEPNDLERVRRVLIELTGIGISAASGAAAAGDIVSETTGTYSYTRGRTATQAMTSDQRRRALIASLLPKQRPSSIRLRSSIIGRRPLLGTVRP